MIASETDYRAATKRLTDERERLTALTQRLRGEGKTDAEVKRVTDPMSSFHLQLAEEVESYERLCRGQFSENQNLHGLGRLLIGLRIARSMSHRELAEKLGVHESQVSRDERNEYHGLTVQRAARILDVLGARLTSHVELDEIAVE
jgi:DNA-binding Xre family transcriptional regulator